MPHSNIGFSMAEKLAIVQTLDDVIIADGSIHEGELNTLSSLMHRLDFETNFILQARNLPAGQGLSILKGMTASKKKALAEILEEMALSDGFIHEKESALITNILSSIAIFQKQV